MEENTGMVEKEVTGWKKALGFVLIVAVCFIAGNIILVLMAMAAGLSLEDGFDIYSAVLDPGMKPFIKAGIGLNHLVMFSGSAVLFAFWLRGMKWKEYFSVRQLHLGLLVSFTALLVCAYPLIGASTSVFEGVEWAQQIDDVSLEALMKILHMDGVPDLIVNLIIVALLPAIGEELLFRGVIQKELVAHMKNPHLAIVLASIIFSGFHFQIQGFLPKFIIGLLMGYSYYWTRSLWYPMILHFLNNGMQTVILFFVGDEMKSLQDEAIEPEKWHLLIGVVFSCFLCYLILTNIRSQISELDSGQSENEHHGE